MSVLYRFPLVSGKRFSVAPALSQAAFNCTLVLYLRLATKLLDFGLRLRRELAVGGIRIALVGDNGAD